VDAEAAGGTTPVLLPERHAALVEVLEEARTWGFLGPGLVSVHITHAMGFAEAVGARPASVADLGSGGGVPGLVLAEAWPDAQMLLVEANQRRAEFLSRAVTALGVGPRVEVANERAEVLGRHPAYRHRYEVATARGFGPPAVTAECAAGLVRLGGRVVVSEPPGSDASRWDPRGLERLGFSPPELITAGATFARMTRTEIVEAFPRRIPTKRPLW
jgi:16S rRNA (guanine527-N7)-methyltransferase